MTNFLIAMGVNLERTLFVSATAFRLFREPLVCLLPDSDWTIRESCILISQSIKSLFCCKRQYKTLLLYCP